MQMPANSPAAGAGGSDRINSLGRNWGCQERSETQDPGKRKVGSLSRGPGLAHAVILGSLVFRIWRQTSHVGTSALIGVPPQSQKVSDYFIRVAGSL
jgi:hypothetical protein